LSPLPPPDLEELLEKLTDRPDVRALQEEARAAGYEEQVGKRWKIPSFTIGAGFKDVQDGPLDLGGPVAYAAVPLPFLNRQEGAIRKARAKRRQAAGASALLLQEARGEIRGLYGKERQLVLVANRFRSQALDPAQDLLQTAEVAYKAGEVGILSLLDAYRSAYEAQTQYLTLALEARRARIELDRSTGGIQ
jgi:cobalt-zinc-cadmium efflux system outer membrane protein